MAYKRAIWILDGQLYLDYLDQCLQTLVYKHPWLAKEDCKHTSYFQEWSLLEQVQQWRFIPTTRRDALINWIIRKELEQNFYLGIRNHLHVPEFAEVHNFLSTHFDLAKHTYVHLQIPRFYGYIETRFAERLGGSIMLEVEFETLQPRSHANRNYTARDAQQLNH